MSNERGQRGMVTDGAGSGERIRSVAPYSRFVRAEGERLESIERELAAAAANIVALRSRINPSGVQQPS